MTKLITIDWDDTIYNLKAVNEMFLLEEYGIHNGYKTVTSFDSLGLNFPAIIPKVWDNPDYYSRGDLLDGAIEFYNNLVSLVGENKIQIVTASMTGVIKVKDEMIRDRYKINCDVIHSVGPKSQYTKGTILVDDYIGNILSHQRVNNGIGLLYNHHRLPYIRNNSNAIDTYFERYRDMYRYIYQQV